MKYSAVLFLIFTFLCSAFAQKPKSPVKTAKSQAKLVEKKPVEKKIVSEQAEFEKAVALTDAARRIEALQKFIEDFPESAEVIRARELIVSARAQLGDERLQAGEIEKGLEFFKIAVREAPKPMSEKLFADVILQFPTNLFFRGERVAAFDVADLIEEKAEGNAKQLLGLATFYLAVESASQARRLANKAIEIETASPSEKSNLIAAYQTLGFANRLGFQLEEAANAYARALELDPESIVSKRSLAEMKRATGKFDEAIRLYRELIEKDENDLTAKTGLTLSLFDTGRRGEAEIEMGKTLEANANNLFLLVGAAYWYAAASDGAKAVELAQQALRIEPRYTWAYIALGRGLMAQKLPLEAEKALLTARSYGNFPTLDYEIAAARLQAGFYREAADELKKKFALKNGALETRLGGRIGVEAEDFLKLLALERKASIFEPAAADSAETAQRLKSLLAFSQEINSPAEDLERISEAADEFIKGNDKMKIHRQLFVANRLLDTKKALPKALEVTRAAISGVDSALDVPNPSAAVLADELYETRNLAMSRNEVLLVPEIPRQTLSAILRGRIEEIAGWTLYQQDKPDEATIRLKRAVSILPEKSSWWRSSVWRLGTALEAAGNQKEALENYIKAYTGGEQPDAAKYFVIESLYEKVNGDTEGLEQKIGVKPAGISDTIAKATEKTNDALTDTSAASVELKSVIKSENSPAAEKTSEIPGQNVSEPTPVPEISDHNNDKIEKPPTDKQNKPVVEPFPTKTERKSEEIEKPVSQTELTTLIKQTTKTETAPTPEVSPIPTTDEKETTVTENNPTVEATPENPPQIEIKIGSTPEPTPTPEVSKTIENPPVDAAKTNETETNTKASPTSPDKDILPNDSEATKPKSEIPDAPSSPSSAPQKKTEKLSVVVTDNALPKTAEKNVETSAKKISEPKKSPDKKLDLVAIFQPVIITVPKSEAAEKPKPPRNIPENPRVNKEPKTKSDQPENKPEEAAAAREELVTTDVSAASRPRVVIEDKLQDDKLQNALPQTKKTKCEISISQENISLINDGGSLGVLVELSGGSLEDLSAVSSSPRDVRVTLDTEFGSNNGRVFFIIKSISERKGIYTVTIESACGKREIQVTVR